MPVLLYDDDDSGDGRASRLHLDSMLVFVSPGFGLLLVGEASSGKKKVKQSSGLGTLPDGQQFIKGWPTIRKHVILDECHGQNLREAALWCKQPGKQRSQSMLCLPC